MAHELTQEALNGVPSVNTTLGHAKELCRAQVPQEFMEQPSWGM